LTVAVVSCVYGPTHGQFIPAWADAIRKLKPAPDQVIVLADQHYQIPGASVIVWPCDWKHPQAFYLNEAFAWAMTEWAWIVDIDDLPHPRALRGLDEVAADVWQMGFDRSDGERYVPPQLSNEDYLKSKRNVYVGCSAIRLEAFHRVGGFQDVALQDWALWRRLAAAGATFQSSGRTHFYYQRHKETRGAVELTLKARAAHLAEMIESEAHASV